MVIGFFLVVFILVVILGVKGYKSYFEEEILVNRLANRAVNLQGVRAANRQVNRLANRAHVNPVILQSG